MLHSAGVLYAAVACLLQTVQLSKRDQSEKADHEKWAEQRAQELAAAAVVPKEQQITALERSVMQLELALAQKAEVGLMCVACGN
jgi:hypothetical protein